MSAIVIAIGFVALLIAESRFPLRVQRSSWRVRFARNVTLAVVSFGILAIAQRPLLAHLAEWEARKPSGISSVLPDNTLVRWIVAFLFLDYTLWVWHWLNHKVPFLWRFHLVHHVDRDLDASTGLRFHFGEMTLSIGFRALQVAILGGGLEIVAVWQSVLFACVLFHHSNVRLPARLDALLTRAIVTPRMHGIHHSMVHAETDSNWSSLLTVWDRLHGTLRLDVPQSNIVIGVPAYAEERDVRVARVFAMPFGRQRDDWGAA